MLVGDATILLASAIHPRSSRVIVMWPSCYPCGFHIPCFLLLITLLVEVPALDSLPSPHATHHRQEHKYLLSHVTPKFKEAVFLVAVVTSPATSYDRRSRLRRQWARNVALLQSEFPSAPSVVMKFALGVNGASEETAAAMQSEEEEWGDILLLHGVRDLDRDEDGWPWQGVSATTEKVLYSIQWAVENFSFDYLARLGDDTYFRPDEFYRQAKMGEFPATMAVIGHFIGPYKFDLGVGEISLVYPSGMGYLLTHDLVAWLASSAGVLSVGYPEDAVVGSWLLGTRAKPVNATDRFHNQRTNSTTNSYLFSRPCTSRDILVHCLNDEEDWQRIDSAGVMTCQA